MNIAWDDDPQVEPVPTPAPAPPIPEPTPAPQPAVATPGVGGCLFELALIAGCVMGVWSFFRPSPSPTPTPSPSVVAIGKDYGPALAVAYGQAWLEGAKVLDAGKTMPEAVAAVSKAWDANRSALFAAKAAPAFAAIVPESTDDKAVTAAQKAQLAAAWRDFAAGLGAK